MIQIATLQLFTQGVATFAVESFSFAQTFILAAVVALIAAVPPSIIGFLSYKASERNKEINTATKKEVVETKEELTNLHLQINSRMQEFMELLKTSSKAEGVLEEKERDKTIS